MLAVDSSRDITPSIGRIKALFPDCEQRSCWLLQLHHTSNAYQWVKMAIGGSTAATGAWSH